MPAQPPDEWMFLRPEEFADDDAVERVDAAFDSSAEETAVHLLDDDEQVALGNLLDSGTTAAVRRPRDMLPVGYFEDEEPEPGLFARVIESDAEPSLDDILTSQHYTFERDGQ